MSAPSPNVPLERDRDRDRDNIPINLPRHNILVRVVLHRAEGLGLTFGDHIFQIEVQCGAIVYHVERSYVDFVELDLRLRKIFPKSSLDSLPLDAYDVIAKCLKREDKLAPPDPRQPLSEAGPGGRRSSMSRAMSVSRVSSLGLPGMGPASAPSRSVLCGNLAGRICTKVKALNLYTRQLLSQHEIIVSDIFIDFISEDSTDVANITEVDLLLEAELPVHVVVRNIEEASFLVKPSQLVVWKFSTAAYDIGFSVEVNSETKLALTRYKCYEKPVTGSIEIGMTGVCVLRWDNSYSKRK
jgi:hypothetical protein